MNITYKFSGFLKFSILKMWIPLLPQTCFTQLYCRPAWVTSLSPTSPSQVSRRHPWLVMLPQFLLTHPLWPIFCIHCVLSSWRRTEDEGYGQRQDLKSVWPRSLKTEVQNSYQQIKSSKNVSWRWPTLYSSHPIHLLLRSFLFSPHHIWITAIIIPWNSIFIFKSLNPNSTWHSNLLHKTLVHTVPSVRMPFFPTWWSFISNVTSLGVPCFFSWNPVFHTPRSFYQFLSMKFNPL